MHIEKITIKYCEENNGEYLELDFRPRLDVRLRFGTWDSGLALLHWCGEKWQRLNTDPGLPLLDYGNDENPHIRRWLMSIPKQIRKRVRPFSGYQWSLLETLYQFEAARELLTDHPVAVWLIAVYLQEQMINRTDSANLLKLRLKEILIQVLGQGPTARIRFLRKIRSYRFTTTDYETIIDALGQHSILEWVRNRRSVSPAQLRLLMHYHDLRDFRLFMPFYHLIGDDEPGLLIEAPEIHQLMEDTRRLGTMLTFSDVERQLVDAPSVDHLKRMHDRWTRRLNRMEKDHTDRQHGTTTRERRGFEHKESATVVTNIQYPAPPYPGTSYIVPISTHAALQAEGKEMNHCVAAFHFDILNRTSSIYKVLYPERCTLEVCWSAFEGTSLGQFKKASNHQPGWHSQLLIDQWFSHHRFSDQQQAKTKSDGTSIALIGIGDCGCQLVKQLDPGFGHGIRRIYVNSVERLDRHYGLIKDKLPLRSDLLAGLPSNPVTQEEKAIVAGFKDLARLYLEGKKQLIIAAGYDDQSVSGIGRTLAAIGTQMKIKTACVVITPYSIHRGRIRALGRMERKRLMKIFDTIQVNSLNLPTDDREGLPDIDCLRRESLAQANRCLYRLLKSFRSSGNSQPLSP